MIEYAKMSKADLKARADVLEQANQQRAERQVKKKLASLLRLLAETVRGVLRATEARHHKIAAGSVDAAAGMIGDIERVMGQFDLELSVEDKMRRTIGELRKDQKTLEMAVELKSLKDVRMVHHWLLKSVEMLGELLRLEIE